jgi:hypothetical protein
MPEMSKEVETNGIEFGEMSSMQMRKIERLFKYAFLFKEEFVSLKEENKNLKEANNILKRELELMEERIGKLESTQK